MHSDRLKQLLKLEKSNPLDAFVKFAIAQELSKIKELEQARKYYEDLLNNHPDYLGTYYHAGKLFEALGEPAKALDIYRNGMVVARMQNDAHTLSELKTVFDSLKDIRE